MVFCARAKVGRLGRDKEGNVFLHGTMIIEVGRLVRMIMLVKVGRFASNEVKKYHQKI